MYRRVRQPVPDVFSGFPVWTGMDPETAHRALAAILARGLRRLLERPLSSLSAIAKQITGTQWNGYRYYSCTSVKRRGTGECPVRAVSAVEIKAFVVDRIKDIGRDPSLLQETLRAAEEDRQRERPELDKEARMLTAALTTSRVEARKLVAALAAGGDMPSVTTRLLELDQRATQLETRLGEVQAKLAAIDRGHIDPEQAAEALAQFDPVWEALVPQGAPTSCNCSSSGWTTTARAASWQSPSGQLAWPRWPRSRGPHEHRSLLLPHKAHGRGRT
jgi:hypothetical protein